jgi:hypothetical protein
MRAQDSRQIKEYKSIQIKQFKKKDKQQLRIETVQNIAAMPL